MEHLTSLFIDDEMNMDDKIAFVHQIKTEPAAADNTLQLLEQEILIREDVVTHIPHNTFPLATETLWRKIRSFVMQPKRIAAASLAGALAVLVLVLSTPQVNLQPSRFVIYRPDVTRAEITGSFTGWQRVPMQSIGSSGYWEIVLALPEGEHHFSYILNGQDSYPDPTILTRELDDFGGQNSVIIVGDTV